MKICVCDQLRGQEYSVHADMAQDSPFRKPSNKTWYG